MSHLAQLEDRDRRFRRLSRALAVVGGVTLLSSLVALFSIGPRPETMPSILGSVVFLGSNLFFTTTRRSTPWMYGVQASEIALIGLVAAVSSDPVAYGGLMLFVIGVALSAKYGLIRSRRTLIAILAAFVVVDAAASHVLHEAPVRLTIAMSAVAAGTYLILYYAFLDEINTLLTDVGTLRYRVSSAEHGVLRLRSRLKDARRESERAWERATAADARVRDLQERLREYELATNPADLERYGFSDREIEVLRTLVQTRARNRDIAATLGISDRTVKCHIYRICNKVGVDTRLELVELFRWNWPYEESVRRS